MTRDEPIGCQSGYVVIGLNMYICVITYLSGCAVSAAFRKRGFCCVFDSVCGFFLHLVTITWAVHMWPAHLHARVSVTVIRGAGVV